MTEQSCSIVIIDSNTQARQCRQNHLHSQHKLMHYSQHIYIISLHHHHLGQLPSDPLAVGSDLLMSAACTIWVHISMSNDDLDAGHSDMSEVLCSGQLHGDGDNGNTTVMGLDFMTDTVVIAEIGTP